MALLPSDDIDAISPHQVRGVIGREYWERVLRSAGASRRAKQRNCKTGGNLVRVTITSRERHSEKSTLKYVRSREQSVERKEDEVGTELSLCFSAISHVLPRANE